MKTLPPVVISHQSNLVYVQVSPCSWMNRGYGLQIGLSLVPNAPGIATAFTLNKEIKATELTDAELQSQALALATYFLATPDGYAQVVEAQKAYAAWRAEAAAHEAEVNAAAALADKAWREKMKAQGFTDCIDYVIHPKNGDDQVCRAAIRGALTPALIKALLRGSVVKTDYRVSPL